MSSYFLINKTFGYIINYGHSSCVFIGFYFYFFIVFLPSLVSVSLEPGMEIGGISRWCERVSDSIFRACKYSYKLSFYGDWVNNVSRS